MKVGQINEMHSPSSQDIINNQCNGGSVMEKLYTYAISIAMVFILVFSTGILAQSVVTVTANGQIAECTDNIQMTNNTDKTVHTIIEEDYPFLKNLDCLTNGYFSDKRNLDLKLRNMDDWSNSHYVLNGTSATIDVEATYDEEGNLIEATLIKKDTQIPIPILRYIYSDEEFARWVMVSNEKIVKDFDPYQTEYKVTLSNGDETEVLHFREQGEMIALVD